MTIRRGPAAAEEQAELEMLSREADAAGREMAASLVALADRLAGSARPAARAGRRLAGAIAVLVVVTVAAVSWERHRRP